LWKIIGNHQLLAHGELDGKFGVMVWRSLKFTYFQQAGGIDLSPISVEITYGLERVALFYKKRIQFLRFFGTMI